MKTGGGAAIKKVVFSDFYVTDEQLSRLGAVVGGGLECLEMSGGEGYQVKGDTLAGLAAACPKLRKLNMYSASYIDDSAFAAIVKSCPDLEYLSICGNDKVTGALSDKSLKLLLKDATLVPKLRVMYVIDQQVYRKVATKLAEARPSLLIGGGESDGDGYASFMVMQAMGGSYGDGLWEVGAGATQGQSFSFDYSEYDYY